MGMPAYSPDLFVNREREIGLVQNIAQLMSEGKSVPKRTIVFRGTRGLGKSWLALHLKRQVLAEFPNILSIFVSFDPNPRELTERDQSNYEDTEIYTAVPTIRNMDYDNAVKYIVVQLIDTIQREIISADSAEKFIPGDVPPGELTGWLVRGIKERFQPPASAATQYAVLALIFDSVFENDWTFLEKLESLLLAPLAALSQVMIILTGRGRDYPWASPYLSGMAEVVKLQPFTLPFVTQQLELQIGNTNNADKILALGGGHPMNTVLIAQELSLKDTVDLLLRVIVDPQDRSEIQIYLEALCVLQGFREEEIEPMVAARLQRSQQLPTDILDRLLKTHLVRWEDRKYVIDESVRSMLEYYLKNEKGDIWQRLHRRAYDLYQGWAREFVRSRQYYEAKAEHHRQTLGAGLEGIPSRG